MKPMHQLRALLLGAAAILGSLATPVGAQDEIGAREITYQGVPDIRIVLLHGFSPHDHTVDRSHVAVKPHICSLSHIGSLITCIVKPLDSTAFCCNISINAGCNIYRTLHTFLKNNSLVN